jgi:hypothetical protein
MQFSVNCLLEAGTGTPVKIDIISESPAVTVGAKAQLKVNLLDVENRPAIAAKDVAIQVEGQLPSGRLETSTVLVRAGQSSGTLELPAKESGPVKIIASTRELASGGSVLNVRAPRQETSVPSVTASPSPSTPLASPHESAARSSPAGAPPIHFNATSHFTDAVRPERELMRAPAAMSTSNAIRRVPAVSPSVGSAWNPALSFMYVPERKIWADGKDAVTVYANLPPDEVAPWDMQIYLMSSIGPLQPEALVISKGQNSGKARLTDDRPGKVSVRFMSSVPWARDVSGLPLNVDFGPTKLKMRVNPPMIGLFESTEVAVQLGDANGNNVSDDEKRDVWLAIESGSGALDQTALTIDPNSGRVTTQFRPILPGKVRLIAESLNLTAADVELNVVTPVLILILCAAGGVSGGLVAFFTDKDARWPRIFIGLVTGFVLYWLLAFGLILIPNFPHILVFNPFSAAVLAVFGGWLGTKVFTTGLQKIGINV